MVSTTKEARIAGLRRLESAVETTDGLSYAQNTILSELPGAAFAFLTLFWIAASFASLL